ncbi:aldehyde dehydrogenase family protein [Gloeocapsa sp. BRSZ]
MSEAKSWDKFYINGEWVFPRGEGQIEVRDPATEAYIRSVPRGNAEDVDSAVLAATQAFPRWAETSLEQRLNFLERFYQGYRSRLDELTEIMRAEVGIPTRFARTFLTEMSGEIIKSAIANARSYQFEQDFKGSLLIREPYGVVAAISPWNNPLFLSLNKIAMALAAGCTVVHKPASYTPGAAFVLAELAHEAEFPKGVFNVISGGGSDTGNALVAHPQVDLVDFTGSLDVGAKIAATAAEGVKKVILELGGKSPLIVLDDAAFEDAIKAGIASAFLLSGQTCGAFTRLLVPQKRLSEAEEIACVVAKDFALGSTEDELTVVGPVVSKSQQQKIQEFIRKGIGEGAKLLLGGAETPEGFERGAYVKPTIFSNVGNQSTIAQEEIFGPVQSIIPYDDDEQAVMFANDTKYGLRAAVWGSEERAIRIAKRIRAGQVDINGDKFTLEAPWGGYKGSGYGRCMGLIGFEEFLQIKSLQIRADLAASYS